MTIVSLLEIDSPGFQKAGTFFIKTERVFLLKDQIFKSSGYIPTNIPHFKRNIFFKSYIL